MKVIKIQETANGFLCAMDDDQDTLYGIEMDDISPEEGITKLLKWVNQNIGKPYDPWTENNLRISWDEKGDEVE